MLDVGREPLVDGASTSSIPRKRDLVNRLAALLTRQRRADPPASAQDAAESLRIRSVGRFGRRLSRPGAAAGRFGRDLALVTEATLSTDPLPRHRGVALLLFDSLEKAARAVHDILADQSRRLAI